MKNIIYIALLITSIVNSQLKEITQIGFNHVVDTKGDTISRHSTLRKSYQTALTQSTGMLRDTFFIDQPTLRIVVEGLQNIQVGRSIDTIILSRRIDIDGDPVRAFGDMALDDSWYILFNDNGMIKFQKDLIDPLQIEYEFERIKEFGVTTYEYLGMPFHFTKIIIYDITETSVSVWIYLSEEIEYLSLIYGEVGTRESDSIEAIGNKITSLTPLKPNIEYQFQIVALNLKGEQITSKLYKFKTL